METTTETVEQKLARLELLDAQAAVTAELEKKIKVKTDAGLTRLQAIAVLDNQRKHDEFIEKLYAERRPAVLNLLKKLGVSDYQDFKMNRDLVMKFRVCFPDVQTHEIIADLEWQKSQSEAAA